MPSRKVVPISSPTNSIKSPITTPTNSTSTPVDAENYQDLRVVKLISQAKFPVYLASSPSQSKTFALKIFPFQNNKPHPYFFNEARFTFLNHENVIKNVHTESQMEVCSNNKDIKASCILMEYAPHGDLFDCIKLLKHDFTEKLARTYFRQLIDGLEHLHNNNVCHFDLKLENLLMGNDYQLKIADFDLSYVKGDAELLTLGTRYFRAPELREGKEDVNAAADIYSAGVILFVLKCGGVLPHTEDEEYKGINLMELMSKKPQEFFERHCAIQDRKSSFFDSGFKELFSSMVREDPEKRISIQEIKNSKWYKGAFYTAKELKKKMSVLLGQ